MAEEQTWRALDHISDITECSLCSEKLKDPKGLPCYHTFCLNCLIKYGEHDKPGDQVACSLCKAKFVIPPGGFADLPNNFYVNKLLRAEESANAFEIPPCDVCKGDEADVYAVNYCVECDENLCDNCVAYHKKLSATKSHELIQCEDKPHRKAMLKKLESYCAQHPEEKITRYCYDCKMVACTTCSKDIHKEHKSADVKKSAEEFRKQLDDDIKKVTRCAQQSRDKLQQLEKESEKGFLENLATTRQAITAAYDELKALLDSHLRKLMEEVDQLKLKRLREIQCKKSDLERQCTVVENCKKYCEEMKKNGTASDISRAANDLHTRCTELVKAQDENNRQVFHPFALTFTPMLTPWTQTPKLIGSIGYRGLAAELVSNCKVLQTVPAANIRAIAQLESALFVCSHASDKVTVYDTNTYVEIRQVTVPGLKQILGLAACGQNNCLYISDAAVQIIQRVDLSNNACSQWPLSAPARGLSLTRAFNLLVTQPQSIAEYTTRGRLIRSITPDVSIDGLQHAIEMSNGQFVVCHMGAKEHRVCVVDTAGRIVHSYGGPQGQSVGQLNGPYRLAVDTHGFVFVADHSHNRVQLLSPTLTHLDFVTVPEQPSLVIQPFAVHFDELNVRLYIGDSKSLLVLCYDATQRNVTNV